MGKLIAEKLQIASDHYDMVYFTAILFTYKTW